MSSQGFEFDYAGVIFGPDLVKNSCGVLLSRAMKGCYVYFMDNETENFFRSRTEEAVLEYE